MTILGKTGEKQFEGEFKAGAGPMQIGKDRKDEGSRTNISPVGIWITNFRCIVHLYNLVHIQEEFDSV